MKGPASSGAIGGISGTSTQSPANRNNTVKLSKSLSYILRHGAQKEGIHMRADGYCRVADILNHHSCKRHNVEDVVSVVDNNDKKRFELLQDTVEGLLIRAVQGHTIKEIDDELLLEEITDPAGLPCCVHGTYARNLPAIMQTGLSRMQRNHIHFTTEIPSEVAVGERKVISGMRKSVDTIIRIDVALAMADSIQFYRSKNGVILSRGLEDSGSIPVKYFKEVISL